MNDSAMAGAAIHRLLVRPDLAHDQALVALASAFTGARQEQLLERLDEVARSLLGVGDCELGDQAHALAELVTNGLCLRVDERDYRALLLDHALATGHAHPVLIATLGHELARRAGLHSLVASSARSHWTVLADHGRIMVVGYGTLPGAHAVTELQPRCAHEITDSTLRAIIATAPLAWKARAALLRARIAAHTRAGPAHNHTGN